MSINMDLVGLDGLEGLNGPNTLPVASISASQSLNASATARNPIATGLARLDKALNAFPGQTAKGGIARGYITEVHGPPGTGKTSLALNVARNALRFGKVVWIDTGCPLPSPRLEQMSMNRDNFVYFRAPTLPHLMALIARPPKNFLPPETCLIVVDSVSSVFPPYFPSVTEIRNHFAVNKKTDKLHLQWLLNRKWNVAGELATHLNRFAARNIAVLTISQSHLKFNGKSKPSLQPIFLGEAWKTNVKTRIALYRDLPHERLACVEKRAGKLLVSKTEDLNVAFRIRPCGVYEKGTEENLPPEPVIPPPKSPEFEYYDPPTPTPSPISSLLSSAPPSSELKPPGVPPPGPVSTEQPPTQIKKRKVDEIADSQDEDSEDEEVAWTDETTLNTNRR